MNRFFNILTIAFATFVLAGTAIVRADRIVTTEPLSQITFSEISVAVEMHASLPRGAGRDPQLLKRLRNRINRTFDEIREQANGDYREFGSDSFNPYSLTSSWAEQFVSAQYLSLLEVSYYYTGGAHGNTGFTSLLWDFEDSREIALIEILDNVEDGSPALKAIARKLREALVAEKMLRNDSSEEEAQNDEGLDQLKATLETLRVFTFVPAREPGKIAGMTFIFGPYYLGSYAEGDFHLFVPASVFQEFLQPEFRTLFGGEPVLMETLTSGTMPGPVILLEEPRITNNITSPLDLKGEAPDYWFEYGVATVQLWIDDIKVAESEIQAYPEATLSGMASGMVRFLGQIEFETPKPNSWGELRFVRGSGHATGGLNSVSRWISLQ